VAGEAAIKINPDDVAGLAENMSRLMDDRELADELRNKGFNNIKRFSWEQTAALTLQAYETITKF
jgi:glycosyltransferase involved in cell wall biosynthesis